MRGDQNAGTTHAAGVDLQPVRRYLASLGYPVDPAAMIARKEQRLSTLCYLTNADRLLMLKRRKEPFAQYWTAPGGKIQDGENPVEAIVREVREETNLHVHNLSLKAICSETGAEHYNWLLFIFRAEGHYGDMVASDEGELAWIPLADLANWALPDIDRRILRYVLDAGPTPTFIRVTYTDAHTVDQFEAVPLGDFAGAGAD